MNQKTNEFSFVLKNSQYGVGVFATHDIKANTHLRLFGDSNLSDQSENIIRNIEDVPLRFRDYCIYRDDKTLFTPKDFGRLETGWYLNHSKNPNATHYGYEYYALRDICAGEEITIDYNTLNEPEGKKEGYYSN